MRRAIVLLVFAGCTPTPPLPPEPPYIIIGADADLDAEGAGTACGAACAHLRELGCPEGFHTQGGHSCAELCDHAVKVGVWTNEPACIQAAGDVSALKPCGVRCR